MSETIQTKRCSKCKHFKPLSDFNKDRNRKDGYYPQCKVCRSKYQKKYGQTKKRKVVSNRYRNSEKGEITHRRNNLSYSKSKKGKATRSRYNKSDANKASHKKYYSRYPEHYKAVYAVNNAIRAGELPRPDTKMCHYCSKPAQQYHHHKGYAPEHWLDVVPVCIPCHSIKTRKAS